MIPTFSILLLVLSTVYTPCSPSVHWIYLKDVWGEEPCPREPRSLTSNVTSPTLHHINGTALNNTYEHANISPKILSANCMSIVGTNNMNYEPFSEDQMNANMNHGAKWRWRNQTANVLRSDTIPARNGQTAGALLAVEYAIKTVELITLPGVRGYRGFHGFSFSVLRATAYMLLI